MGFLQVRAVLFRMKFRSSLGGLVRTREHLTSDVRPDTKTNSCGASSLVRHNADTVAPVPN